MAEERRTLEIRMTTEAEVRALDSEDGKPKIVGYAAVFGQMSDDLGGFREIIAPGAFGESLRSTREVFAYRNHNENFLLGTTMSKTLRLQEDAKGLRYEIDPPDTEYTRDLIKLIRRGDVRGSSFAFRLEDYRADQSWRRENGVVVRELRRLVLGDVSVVSRPAYPQTDVAVRCLQQWITESSPPPALDLNLRRRLELAEAEA